MSRKIRPRPTPTFDGYIGDRIQRERENCGLSQADLGAVMAKTRSHAAISDIEAGKTRITVALLDELAYLLGKPFDWFLQGVDKNECYSST